jgi:predicted RNA-binding Zn-ribbon protein involved in translation (DUF1610 family)
MRDRRLRRFAHEASVGRRASAGGRGGRKPAAHAQKTCRSGSPRIHTHRMRERAVTVACPQCGELVEVKDPTALILGLHMHNDCNVSGLLVHHDGDDE